MKHLTPVLCVLLAGCGSVPSAGLELPVAASSGCDRPSAPSGLSNGTIEVGGVARTYVLSIPSPSDRPQRVVFAFHGAGGNGSNFRQWFGTQVETAAQNKGIFVYPDGIDAVWPNTDGRDIAFFDALLARLEASACVDSNRVFATGFSYGGYMSNTVGCARAGVVRAIAPLSGGLPWAGSCNGEKVAAWISHGDADPTVKLDQGQTSRDHWREVDQCGIDTLPADPSPCVTYKGCAAGYPVVWCQFQGDHEIPSWAPAAIAAFFGGL